MVAALPDPPTENPAFRELNRELMKLELAGMLWVSRLAKGKRLVALTGKTISG